MKFRDFVTMNKEFAIVITPKEYRSIKDKLREFYTNEDLEDIDEFCQFEYSTGSFFLCNLRLKSRIITPCMSGNAVTFVDRIMFRDIEFEEESQMNYNEMTEITVNTTTEIPFEAIIVAYGLDYWATMGDIEKAVITYLTLNGCKKPTLPKQTLEKLYARHTTYWALKINRNDKISLELEELK